MFRKTLFAMLGAGMLMGVGIGSAGAQSPTPVAPPVALNPQPLPPGAVLSNAPVTCVPACTTVVYRHPSRVYYRSYRSCGPRVVVHSRWRGRR